MPLELQNFIVPKNSTEGLYKIAEQMQQQKAAQAKAAKDEAQRKQTGARYITALFDNKESSTGTDLDIMFNNTMAKGKQAAIDEYSNGGDYILAQMVAAPYINKAHQIHTAAKNFQLKEKELLKQINDKTNGAVDPALFSQKLRERVFKKDDKTGDLNYENANPENVLSIADDVLKNDNVYNEDKAVQNWVKNVPALDYGVREKTKNADGSYTDKVYNVQHPFFVQPIVDETTGKLKPNQFEVKYDIVKDASGNTLLDETGQQHRVVPQDIMTKLEGTPLMGAIDAQTKEILNQHGKGVTIDSPEGQLVKSAIAYHMLDKANSYTKGKSREVIDEGERTDLAKRGMIEFTAQMRKKYHVGTDEGGQGNVLDEYGLTGEVPVTGQEIQNFNGLDATVDVPKGKIIVGADNSPLVVGNDNKPMISGVVDVSKSNSPQSVIDVLVNSKVPVRDKISLIIKNGKINGIQTEGSGIIPYEKMQKNFQKNVLGGKEKQTKEFGTKQQAKQAPKQAVSNKKPNKHGI